METKPPMEPEQAVPGGGGSGGPDPGSRRRATVAWFFGVPLFLLVAGLQILSAQTMQAESGRARAEASGVAAPGAPDQLTIVSKILVAVEERVGGAVKGAMLGELESAVRGPVDAVRVAVVKRELADAESEVDPFAEARSRLEDTEDPEDRGAFEDLDEETRQGLLRDLELLGTGMTDGPEALGEAERRRLRDRHGWFAELALTHALDQDADRRAEIRREGMGVLALVAGAGVTFLGALAAGLVLLVVGGVLVSTGRLRPRFVRPARGGSVYLEMFPVFVGAFLVHQMVTLAVGAVAGAVGGDDARAVAGQWYGLLGQWLLLGVVAWPVLVGVPWRRARRDLGLHAGRGVFREIGAGLVGYLAGLPVLMLGVLITALLLMLFQGEDGPAPGNPVMDRIVESGPVGLILLGLLAVVWAPLVEESVFRGALYRHLRGVAGVLASALLVGLLFAFMHGYGPIRTPPLIALALTFAMLREWRGSLIAPITAHFLHNVAVMGFLILVMRLGS